MSPVSASRIQFALACYVVLAVLAGFTLDGLFRAAVWMFLGGLAVKTLLLKWRRDD
jgi:hypothetical protein